MLTWLFRRRYPIRRERPVVLAHRGASADAPENTLAAFREAMRQGADGIELDVMRCGSGELVVCHDPWLDRLTGMHLEVAATPLSELRRLDFGRRFSERFAGERMATLSEVLAVIPRAAVCNVEIKCETLRDRGLSLTVARQIHRSEAGQEMLVSSFNPLVLARLRLFAPRLRVAVLVEASQNLSVREAAARAMRAWAIHAEHPLCTPERVRHWHEMGLKVAAWTVDDPGDIERCCAANVDAIITNRPRAALALMERLGIDD